MKPKRRVSLIVLDGWGIGRPGPGNAIFLAKPKVFNYFWKNYPKSLLCASGSCVGLPSDQPGNSEAGHLNLGAGRIVEDDAVFISKSIKNKSFFRNGVFWEGIRHFKKHPSSKIHLMGLVTEGNSAHSSPEHWLAMLEFLKKTDVGKVYLHIFTDGRDSSQHGAITILYRFNETWKKEKGNTKTFIASVCGRFYAMDRSKAWSRTEKAYNLLTLGEGEYASNAQEAIRRAYNRGQTDEFIEPTVIVSNNKPIATIDDNDVVIFMNLRSDRARQLAKAFVQKEFNKRNPASFRRKKRPKNLFFIALTDFGPDLDDIKTAFPHEKVKNSLPIALGKDVSQLYIAEAEKYAHVTFFFNGGYDHPVAGERRVRIPSPKVSHYDKTPAMSSFKVVSRLNKEISKTPPDFFLVNLCNPDMLGHTGNIEATTRGIKVVNQCLEKIVKKCQEKDYTVLVTADHGNAEEMIDVKTGEVLTTHTTNPVPFILIEKRKRIKLKKNGILADVAPTILELMGFPQPKEMTGSSLIASGI